MQAEEAINLETFTHLVADLCNVTTAIWDQILRYWNDTNTDIDIPKQATIDTGLMYNALDNNIITSVV
jgi:hypothetical protein